MAAPLSALLLLHSACFASQVSTLIILFSFGQGGDVWVLQASALLLLLLLISCVCSLAAWKELKSLQLPCGQLCAILPLALPLLGLGQLIQPWLAWKERRTGGPVQRAQLHRGRMMVTAPPRFSCSGVESVTQGAAFAAVSLWSLTWSVWHPPGMALESRVLLGLCAALSLLSASLSLVEMDFAVSDTAQAARHAVPLHVALRAAELCARIFVVAVLASLSGQLSVRGVPVPPFIFLMDYALMVCAFLGDGHFAWLLALGSMTANLLKFVDSAAWSIRARKLTRRLALLRHLELLAAMLGAGLWLAGRLGAPRHGPVRSWKDLELFLSDGRNALPLLGASCVLLYHVMSFSLEQLHKAQVRADGLHRAAARGDAEALQRLLREMGSSCPGGASLLGLNALSPEGWAPLHLATAANAERALKVLLHARAEVSVPGAGGMTALMLAAEAGHDKALRLLLGAAQGISSANTEGNTALHLAVRSGHSECIHRLLRARADATMVNAQGFTAFQFARSKFTESLNGSAGDLSRDAFFEVLDTRSLRPRPEEEAQTPRQTPRHTPRQTPRQTPRLSPEGSPHRSPRPSSSGGSVLDVPVMAAAESALDDLLAEAARGGLRLSHVATSVLTEATTRSCPSPTPPPIARHDGRAVKITGLASLLAVASPGALRRLVAQPCENLEHGKGHKLSNFRIVGFIGEGSFGSVYEACDLRPGASLRSDHRCALKILHRRQYLAQDMLARAKQERQVLKAARHPFIVRLLCAFRTPGNEMALVMEYCCNGNVNDLIVRSGHPGIAEQVARKLLAEVLMALAYLHDELDVVFRDIKPENIVLDTAMHAKLTDFGLAKAEASRGAFSFVGSTYFVAPEVTLAEGRYSFAVDLYALGLVAWVCLTGGRPAQQEGKESQRLPPPNHEAMRSWLEERRGTAVLSDLAFSFIDVCTSSEPARRQTARDLRGHPFFAESSFYPRLASSLDWEALLPSTDEEPLTPGSVATQDSWSWDARHR